MTEPATPAAPEGFTRLLMKTRFGAGRDFRVLDPTTEAELYVVDGKLGPRPRAEILDQGGMAQFEVVGRLMGIPKRMDVADARGNAVAHLRARPFTFVRDKIEVTLASGEAWLLEGNLIEKDYSLRDAQGALRVQITQRWLTLRDTYTVDVAHGVEPGLAFALAWAIDRWVERD